MKKILTAIGNSTLNNKLQENKKYNVLSIDIDIDEKLIEYLEREEEIDILFICSNIIKNYDVNEFIEIIRKIQEDIFIVFFKDEKVEIEIKEDDKLEIYNSFNFDLKILEKILKKNINKNIKNNTSKIISISGANGVRKKYVFHISCKKCGK